MKKWTCGVATVRGDPSLVTCGKYCTIENNVVIYTGGINHNGYVTTFPFGHVPSPPGSVKATYTPCTGTRVTIGNDVWIGDSVRIYSGVTIGDGAIVTHGSYVTSDVPPYGIVTGNPARLLRYRCTENQINQLLLIKWWFWPDSKVAEMSGLLCSGDVDEFITRATYQ